MQFYTVRDLRTSPKNVWDSLGSGEVVITNNGRPAALMLDISGGNFEEVLQAVRQARAMIAVNRMRESARKTGLDKMSLEEINAEIAAAREDDHAHGG